MTNTPTIQEALALTDMDPEWLCEQLERWPNRVHQQRTTNIGYLDESATTIIAAASAAETLPLPLDHAMVERLKAAHSAFRRKACIRTPQ